MLKNVYFLLLLQLCRVCFYSSTKCILFR